jgi:Ca2+-binding RTX toxin-like protein
VFAGQGNDSAVVGGSSNPLYFLNEGNDTFDGDTATGAMTVVGGNDALDGNDSILTGNGADIVYGNGGNDTIRSNEGGDTVIGGVGSDSLQATGNWTDLIFANEGDDTVQAASGSDTVFAGQGNDQVSGGATGGQLLQGNEGNDTIIGLLGIDTLSGGSGADVFYYFSGAADDGDNANAGGPVEQITDVNFDEDRFRVLTAISFAAQTGPGAAANLEDAADNALAASLALGGGGAQRVAATFAFNGRTYLAIDQGGAFGAFTDALDLLMDVTGATGTIGAGDFFV